MVENDNIFPVTFLNHAATFAAFVQSSASPYNPKYKRYSLLMIVALLWLTISVPFVNAQQAAEQTVEWSVDDNDTGDCDPLTNTTEEGSENGANTLQEEYLHTAHQIEHHFLALTTYYKCHTSDLYFAYHPDTLSPPPDLAVA